MSRFAAESTLTDRYRTTVTEPVRRALNLGKRAHEYDDDAYRVIRRMLTSGRPPDDWARCWPMRGRKRIGWLDWRPVGGLKARIPSLAPAARG